MLLVKCQIKVSPIHGLGLFALEDIPAHTMTWRFDASVDTVYSIDDYARMASDQRISMRHFAYLLEDKRHVLCGDAALFMNHSNDPSVRSGYTTGPYGEDIARRFIAKGEELTCNYNEFDFDAEAKFVLNL